MIRKLRSSTWARRLLFPIFGVVVAFLVSATAAAVFNHEGNTGAQVAEAAGRVNRQVDDTQAAFKDIKELIPEEERLEAAPPDSYVEEPTSGDNREMDYRPPTMPASPGGPPAPPLPAVAAGDGHQDATDHSHPIDPDNGGSSGNPDAVGETEGNDGDGNGKNSPPPTLTFNQKAREIQGDRLLTQHQEAMDKIVGNWTPQYEAAKREHEELVERISDTRELWPEYQSEQVGLIQRQNNPRLRDIMEASLLDDTRAYNRWNSKASDVERRSMEALSKIEDMNTFLLFYKNQSDFKAIAEYDDLDVPLQVGLLLESLDAFEAETSGLAEAMKAS